MTNEEARNLYRLRTQQLHLTVIYEAEFLQKIGKRRLEEMRDNLLDELIYLRKYLKNA
jgi:hypothetical protein